MRTAGFGRIDRDLLALVAVAILVVAAVTVSSAPPALLPGTFLVAAPLLLNTLGVMVAYRGCGFLNLAQVQIAVFSAALMDGLVRGNKMVIGIYSLCPSCVDPTSLGTPHMITLGIGILAAVVAAVALSGLFYALVVRRLGDNHLLAMVASVFLAQALAGVQPAMTDALVSATDIKRRFAWETLHAPWAEVSMTILGTQWGLWTVVSVVATAVVLGWLGHQLRRGGWGMALRAHADDKARLATMGHDPLLVAGKAFIAAGAFAALAGVCSGLIANAAVAGRVAGAPLGTDTTVGLAVEPLIVMLTAMLFARFRSIPKAVVATLLLAALQEALTWMSGSDMPMRVAAMVIVLVLTLIQRGTSAKALRAERAGLHITRELRGVPRELAHLAPVVRYRRYGTATGLVVMLSAPFLFSAGGVTLLTATLAFTLVALSLLVLTGWAGQISFGQYGLAAVGAWVFAVSGLPLPVALLLAGIVGAAVMLGVGAMVQGRPGAHLAVVTLAVAVGMHGALFDPALLGRFIPGARSGGMQLGLTDPVTGYYTCLLVVAGSCLGLLGLRRSRWGRASVAMRSNPSAAQAFGIDPTRLRLGNFALSGGLAALGGGLTVAGIGHLDGQQFVPDQSITVFLFTLLGGLGSLVGPLLGSLFYGCTHVFFGGSPLVSYVGAGAGALLLLLAFPGGLAELVAQGRDKTLLRMAYRLRIPVPSLMGDGGIAAGLGKAPLDESRRPLTSPGMDPIRGYLPEGQWAFGRRGSADQISARIGEGRP